jgi:hypothetical protein
VLMGFRSRRAVDGDVVFVTVPVPGWLKNELVGLAEGSGVSFQRLVVLLLTNGVRVEVGKPSLQVGGFVEPLSGVVAYLRGERRLEPCGLPVCVKVPVDVLGSSFCDVCGVCLRG